MTQSQAQEAPIRERKKTEINVVEKIHALLKEKALPLAEQFPEMKYVKQAENQPEVIQRHLVNRQLRLHLGEMAKPTSIARLALDDDCSWNDYIKNFKIYVLPEL